MTLKGMGHPVFFFLFFFKRLLHCKYFFYFDLKPKCGYLFKVYGRKMRTNDKLELGSEF